MGSEGSGIEGRTTPDPERTRGPDGGLGDPLDPAYQYFVTSPPTQVHDDVARASLDGFIAGR
jgi:hypothetical protein